MFRYRGISINYVDYGKRCDNAIVYLHGWGQNIEMMEPIAKPFVDTHRVIIIDLPGFGKSEEPKEIWSLEDYAVMIYNLLKELNIKSVNLIGHSFGGKISLVYAMNYKVSHMILLASPFKVTNKKISFKVKVLKKLKNVPGLGKIADKIKSRMGSLDYRNATPMMRNIMVKHVNTDLSDDLDKIKCPTFIIWGDKDEAVNVDDAYILEKRIKDSGLVVYPGCSHYAYLENLGQTIAIIKSFMS